VVLGIQGVDKKRNLTKENHSEEDHLAKKPKAISGVGRALVEKIRGRIYEVESEDK
jgi:hypothetical protein